MDDKSKKLIEKMEKERGFGRLWRRLLAERDPEHMELIHNTTARVLKDGALPRKFKEIICICVDAIQFYEPGIRIHTRNALSCGATEMEIIEALEATALPGIHYLSVPLPAVVEECENFKKGKKAEDIYEDKKK